MRNGSSWEERDGRPRVRPAVGVKSGPLVSGAYGTSIEETRMIGK